MGKKRKLRAKFEGRGLVAKCNVELLDGGTFAYKGFVYDIDEFPQGATVNLDKMGIEPLCRYVKSKKSKKRKGERKVRRNLVAWLYTNAEECPDVAPLFKNL